MEYTLSQEQFDAHIKEAHKEGYFKCLDDYAIWKDGVQRIGCGEQDIKDIMANFDKRGVA